MTAPETLAELNVTHATIARGLLVSMVYYGPLDRVPHGSDEGEPDHQSRIRPRDQYAGDSAVTPTVGEIGESKRLCR